MFATSGLGTRSKGSTFSSGRAFCKLDFVSFSGSSPCGADIVVPAFINSFSLCIHLPKYGPSPLPRRIFSIKATPDETPECLLSSCKEIANALLRP
ncbi:hypothetical protein BDZ91DRAFT_725285 [Kalaharituber pfeilii]|nr:hypothetical protein BDZ91DRAFT_725285 [Kalaharituber pfeilii]